MNLAMTWGLFVNTERRVVIVEAAIDDIAKSLRNGFGVRWRQQRRGIYPAGKERAQSFGVSPGLDKKDILFRIHPSATEGLDAEIMRIAADPRDTDFLAF
jgi:hypothetical protein